MLDDDSVMLVHSGEFVGPKLETSMASQAIKRSSLPPPWASSAMRQNMHRMLSIGRMLMMLAVGLSTFPPMRFLR